MKITATLKTKGRQIETRRTLGGRVAARHTPEKQKPKTRPPVHISDLWIQTKERGIINLGENLTEVQEIALDEMAPNWRTGDYTFAVGFRGVCLKARQLGITTLGLAITFLNICNRSDCTAVFIADNDPNSEAAFQKMFLFWDMLPEEKKPPKKYSNRKELSFRDNRSSVTILTAGAGRVGHSRTFQIVHGSEVAFWANAAETAPGLMNSVPAGGAVLLESTAWGDGEEDEETGEILGGRGAFFAVTCKKAKTGKNGYTQIFLPWWQQSEYQIPIADGMGFLITDETWRESDDPLRRRAFRRYGNEQREQFKYGLTLEQLLWRRAKIDSPGMGQRKFRQEFPSDDTEPFKVNGAIYFDEWDPDLHVGPYQSLEELVKTYGPITEFRGGLDFGTASPFAFYLAAIWRKGNKADGEYVHIEYLEEAYGPRIGEKQQAQMCVAAIQARGLKLKQVPIFADPSMFPPMSEKLQIAEKYTSDYFTDAGLLLYRAENSHEVTFPHAKVLLAQPGCIVFQEQCTNAIATIPGLIGHPTKPYDFAPGSLDHAADASILYLPSGKIPVAASKPSKTPAYNPGAMIGGFKR